MLGLVLSGEVFSHVFRAGNRELMLPFPYSVRCGIFSVATALTGQYARFGQHPGKKTLRPARSPEWIRIERKTYRAMLNHNVLFWGGGNFIAREQALIPAQFPLLTNLPAEQYTTDCILRRSIML